jgi:hypothetical protein
MPKLRPPASTPRPSKLIKLAIQATRHSTRYTISGRKKEGSDAPKPVTLPKLKCLEEEDHE